MKNKVFLTTQNYVVVEKNRVFAAEITSKVLTDFFEKNLDPEEWGLDEYDEDTVSHDFGEVIIEKNGEKITVRDEEKFKNLFRGKIIEAGIRLAVETESNDSRWASLWAEGQEALMTFAEDISYAINKIETHWSLSQDENMQILTPQGVCRDIIEVFDNLDNANKEEI